MIIKFSNFHNNKITRYIISEFKKLSNIVKNNVKITKSSNINFFYMCKKFDNFITYFFLS